MSVDGYAMELDDAARAALAKAGAIEGCSRHPDVTIRLWDDDAERKAYAIATNSLKREGTMWQREDLMDAIKDVLDMAADGECPGCAKLLED